MITGIELAAYSVFYSLILTARAILAFNKATLKPETYKDSASLANVLLGFGGIFLVYMWADYLLGSSGLGQTDAGGFQWWWWFFLL